MTAVKIYLIFLLTYAGMIAGRLPWLRIDRTGIALVGLILLLATEALTLDEIGARIDMPTLLLLFALMIISAQFVISGFCDAVFAYIARVGDGPLMILALVVACTGALAAFLANDILLFVATPLMLDMVRDRRLDPRPYLIALITASNAGSAATIIGAPHTIIIGQLGNLHFSTYLLACGVPAVMALLIAFIVIALVWRGRLVLPAGESLPDWSEPPVAHRPYDRQQTNKGIVAVACLIALFSTDLPKDVFSLPIAALLLLNRHYASRELIAGVDWPLLLLIVCLFGVTGALGSTALPGVLIDKLQSIGMLPDNLLLLTPLTLIMSSTIGTVPGVVLFLQLWQSAPADVLYGLALLTSLAGNLFRGGNLSNFIITERAEQRGVVLTSHDFMLVGIPITAFSVAFAVFWLEITEFMPFLPGGAPTGG